MRHREYISDFPRSFSPSWKIIFTRKGFHNEKTRTPSTRVADPDTDPSLSLIRIRIRLFTLMRILIQTFHFNADPDPAPHLRPLFYRLSMAPFWAIKPPMCAFYHPSRLHVEPPKLLRFDFNLDPVPAFHFKGAQAWPNRVLIFLHKSNLYG